MWRISLPLSVLLLCSCSSAPHSAAEKYFLVVSNTKSPYWDDVAKGLNRAARDLEVTAAVTGPDSFSTQGQKDEFRRVVALKPAGILVSPSDPKSLSEDIDAAISAGIPVITVDSDAPASRRLFFVGTNNYEAGQVGGRAAAKLLNGKGSVIVFLTVGHANMEERLSGYREAFAAYPQIKIADVVDLKGDPRIAFDYANHVLEQGTPAVDAFLSMDGQSAKEIAEVLGRKKASKVVIAMDALPGTLEGIDKGAISATVTQKPFTMGYIGLRMLADLHLHKLPTLQFDFNQNPNSPLPRFVSTGLALVDKTSLPLYREASTPMQTPKK